MKKSLKTFIISAIFAFSLLAPHIASAQYGPYSYSLGYNLGRPAGTGFAGYYPYVQQCVTAADCVNMLPKCESSLTSQGKAPLSSQCARTQGYSTGRVMCLTGMCTFPPMRNTNVLPQNGNPNYCQTGNDCTLVTDSCGNQTAVNTTYAGQRQTAATSRPCARPAQARAVKELSCQYNQCTVLFDNYPSK